MIIIWTPKVWAKSTPAVELSLEYHLECCSILIPAESLIFSSFPSVREDVGCFGDDTCYSLAFGIPALLMFVATVILIIGRPMYVMKPPQGNIVTKVVGSIVVR